MIRRPALRRAGLAVRQTQGLSAFCGRQRMRKAYVPARLGSLSKGEFEDVACPENECIRVTAADDLYPER